MDTLVFNGCCLFAVYDTNAQELGQITVVLGILGSGFWCYEDV